MTEAEFDQIGRAELSHIEEALADVDPDEVDMVRNDGVLTLHLRDGVRVVVNTHRAARQIWLAAVSTAWHFDPPSDGHPRWSTKEGADLRQTLSGILQKQLGLTLSFE